MSGTEAVMSVARACEVLGVARGASPGELRHAFRQAAKAAHPDRPGGSADRFREVVEAHHVLQRAGPAPKQTPHRESPSEAPSARAEPSPKHRAPPPPPEARRRASSRAPTLLSITPHLAATGGDVDHVMADGRRVRIVLPAGLRAGDRFRADEDEFEVVVRGDGVTIVRGDDLWITLPVEAKILSQGGRVTCDTPHGRRVVMITKKAAAQGLVRLQGQGLPPRGRHRQGHMFLRLEPAETKSAARSILRRLAGGWAA